MRMHSPMILAMWNSSGDRLLWPVMVTVMLPSSLFSRIDLTPLPMCVAVQDDRSTDQSFTQKPGRMPGNWPRPSSSLRGWW